METPPPKSGRIFFAIALLLAAYFTLCVFACMTGCPSRSMTTAQWAAHEHGKRTLFTNFWGSLLLIAGAIMYLHKQRKQWEAQNANLAKSDTNRG